MALTIEQIQAVGIPRNISKLNNRSLLGVALPNDSVNLYDAIALVTSGLSSGGVTDLTATQNTATTSVHSSSGNDVIILAADATRSGVMSATQADYLTNLVTLTGVSGGAAHLGTFSGTTISDSSTIKTALQSLETAIEAVAGESSQDAVGSILTDSATIDFTYDDATPSITASIIDNSVTLAKIQTVATARLLGRSTAGTGNVEQISIGSGLSLAAGTLSATGGSGTVTSVAATVPGFLAISGSPITTSGTLAISLNTQAANTVFSGPTSGTSTPTFRALVAGDIPTLTSSKISDFNESVDDRVDALLVEGTGISLTYDDGGGTLTIAATGTAYTDEQAQDAIGTILVDSTTIDLAYSDATPSITAGVKASSIENNHLASGTGGLYKGSGTLGSGVVAKVPNNSSFRFNYFNDNPALLVDDLNAGTGIYSEDGVSYLYVDNTQLLVSAVTATIESPVTFDEYVVLPSYDTTGRNALTATAGMTIFNTTTSKLECYDGSTWQAAW